MKFVCPNCQTKVEVGLRLEVDYVEMSPTIPSDDWRERLVENMEFSTRTTNCLHNANLKTMGEVDDKTDRELLLLNNFGKRSLWEVREAIQFLKDRFE